jgi:hypothetical protein
VETKRAVIIVITKGTVVFISTKDRRTCGLVLTISRYWFAEGRTNTENYCRQYVQVTRYEEQRRVLRIAGIGMGFVEDRRYIPKFH